MNESAALRTAFKLSGFVIKSDTCNFLLNQLSPLEPSEKNKWLNLIIENIQRQKLDSINIEQKHIEVAIREINQVGLEDEEAIFSIINAFDVPRYIFEKQKKKYELDTESRQFLAKASMKAKYMQHRYIMLHQKTIRHELFSPAIEGVTSDVKKFQLSYIENLLSSNKIDEVVVLGLLTQFTEGKFFLEDMTGYVQLDLTKAQYHPGFFFDGSFVLIEGNYQDNCIYVTGIGFPPAESAKSSRSVYGIQNTWGGISTKLLKYSNRLMNIERTNTEATIVFLSDIRLDIPIIMEKLKILFTGYDDCPPIAIVLMGPFSKPSENSIQKVKQLFQNLADLTNTCERLRRETDLILVPSTEDFGAPNILPRPSITEYLVTGLKQKWGNRLRLATNPCRLQYCTQQIVVCRADLVTKFCRNTIHFPESGKIPDHFARTLICQGHLAPINANALPVYWDYDAALWLYPLPDLVVIGDISNSFNKTQLDCTILNTGSFYRSKFSFKVYVPSTKTIEDSEVPDEMEIE